MNPTIVIVRQLINIAITDKKSPILNASGFFYTNLFSEKTGNRQHHLLGEQKLFLVERSMILWLFTITFGEKRSFGIDQKYVCLPY